jgi:hypothetical protein
MGLMPREMVVATFLRELGVRADCVENGRSVCPSTCLVRRSDSMFLSGGACDATQLAHRSLPTPTEPVSPDSTDGA